MAFSSQVASESREHPGGMCTAGVDKSVMDL